MLVYKNYEITRCEYGGFEALNPNYDGPGDKVNFLLESNVPDLIALIDETLEEHFPEEQKRGFFQRYN